MLHSLDLTNLTVFPRASLHFSHGLNVIVGENGLGKSHLLKMAYSILAVSYDESTRPTTSRAGLQTRIADKLMGVFRPEGLGRLASRQQGRSRCQVACGFDSHALDLSFSFSTNSKSEVAVTQMPKAWVDKAPVYLPTRELLTIYPGLVSLYATRALEFDETYRDTCILLGQPSVRGPREAAARAMLKPLEEAMGGRIVLEHDRFYLNLPGQGRMEMHLVAEGLRKLAMIARLIATGSLLDKGFLFWDEPETNLNPTLISKIARTILELCRHGIQIFIASHSLHLMRELDILLRSDYSSISARFFGIRSGERGAAIVEEGASLDEIGDISALDAQIEQCDRYLSLDTQQ